MKIAIVGTSGSGKTTLARKLEADLGIKHIELDSLYWLPGWKKRDRDDFLKRVKESLKGDDWIACGNYSIARDIVWKQADVLIWLDYSLWRCLWGVLKRAARGNEQAPGCKDSLTKTLFSRSSVILWVLQSYSRRKREMKRDLTATEYEHLEIIEAKSPRDLEEKLKPLLQKFDTSSKKMAL